MLVGCSSSRGVLDSGGGDSTGFPNHTVEQIREQVGRLRIPVEAYQAESSLSVRSPYQSGSFSADIQHRANDSLLISISPGLGIVAVKMLITPDSFFVYDRINKELSVGSLASMQAMLPLPLTPAALFDSMLGLLTPEAGTAWTLSSNKNHYIMNDSSDRLSYTIDPVLWRVLRFEERDDAGELVEERTFTEFEDYDGVYLPRRLTFRRPGDDTAASLYYRKLTVNPVSLSFDFDVAPSVKRTSIQ